MGNKIGIIPYLKAVREDLKNRVVKELTDCDFIILKNHGSIAVGSNLKEAYYRIVYWR